MNDIQYLIQVGKGNMTYVESRIKDPEIREFMSYIRWAEDESVIEELERRNEELERRIERAINELE